MKTKNDNNSVFFGCENRDNIENSTFFVLAEMNRIEPYVNAQIHT